jgi:hypothetical protein
MCSSVEERPAMAKEIRLDSKNLRQSIAASGRRLHSGSPRSEGEERTRPGFEDAEHNR